MATEVKAKEEYFGEIKEITEEKLISSDKVAKGVLFAIASTAIIIIFLIIIYLFSLSGNFFTRVPLEDFLLGTEWVPGKDKYGALYLILGTLLAAMGGLIFAIPIGIGAAVFISEVAPKKIRGSLKGAVEILAGIPSIIYGYFGHIVLKVFIQDYLGASNGACWLNASFLLGIMALPTIISVCEDAINAVPRSYREASYAMGATKWQTISKVVLPAAISGITAGVILGMGRAIGETITVTMVAGNSVNAPTPITDVFAAIQTITATLALQIKNAGGLHQMGLFALGIILFFISLIINIFSSIYLSKIEKKFRGKTKEKQWKKSKIIQKIKNDPAVKYLSNIIRKYKGFVLKMGLFLILTWVFTTWFGVINGFLIGLGLFILSFTYKRLKPHIQQIIAFCIIALMTIFILVIIGIIVFYIFEMGLPAVLTPSFLTEPSMGEGGGILHAIVGTLELVGLSMLIAIPLGVFAGIYLNEYAKKGYITKAIRLAIDSLNGTPSIVFGLFGYAILVNTFKTRSLLAGGITLALMILPVIIRTTEEGLNSVPESFRRGSLALGSSKWQSITKIALPAAMPAIITGIVLGMGRVAGETAPILFTACVFVQRFRPLSIFSPDGLLKPVGALTFHLYTLWLSYDNVEFQAGGTALTLLLVVLAFYGIAFIIRSYYNKKRDW